MTLTRRRMRVSKYNILVNTVGAVVGAKLTDTYFINIKQLLKDSKDEYITLIYLATFHKLNSKQYVHYL
jgi:hypothetical protein